MKPTHKKNNLKIALIQIRREPEVLEQEKKCFLNFAHLSPQNLKTFNTFENPQLSIHDIKHFDALFVGGAGEASVLDIQKFSFVPALIQTLKDAIEQNMPTFASCFGFQAATLALNGKVISSPDDDFEMGTVEITLTDSAHKDPIFKKIPDKFFAVSVHQQKVVDLPNNCELLAYSPDCIHSFKVKNKPFWAFQFHPEVTRAVLVDRLATYQTKYTKNQEHYHQVISKAQETPESNRLLANFMEYLQQRKRASPNGHL